jgi:hypothetical protein
LTSCVLSWTPCITFWDLHFCKSKNIQGIPRNYFL